MSVRIIEASLAHPASRAGCNAVDAAAQSRRVVDGLIAAPIEWYHGPSPWGPSVTALSSVVEMFTAVADEYFAPRAPDASGAFTALELRYHGEPVLCDVEYAVDGRFTPDERTPMGDAVWCDMTARDQHGHLVASARMRAEFATAAAPGRRADRSPATARALG